MNVIFGRMPGSSRSRTTVTLAPGQTVADAWAEHQGAPWLENDGEVIIVGDARAGVPLQTLPLLRERAARGALVVRTFEEQDDVEVEELRARHALTEEDAAALVTARRQGPRVRPPHPAAADLPRAPSSPSKLPPVDLGWRRWFERWRTPRHSPLASHVGPRLGPEELGEAELEPEVAARVRAWPVPGLVGRVLVAPGVDALPGALRALLHETFGDLPFGAEDGRNNGGLGVHLHLHACLTAPPNGVEPMALELYGEVLAVGDHDLESPSGARLLLQRSRECDVLNPLEDATQRPRFEQLLVGEDLPTPLFIIIRSATYSNVWLLGAGVPFYS